MSLRVMAGRYAGNAGFRETQALGTMLGRDGTSIAPSPDMATRIQTLPGWFSDQEEEFFREGSLLGQAAPVESFDDLDAGYERPGFFRRLFGKRKR
jgi:hypothetical protein